MGNYAMKKTIIKILIILFIYNNMVMISYAAPRSNYHTIIISKHDTILNIARKYSTTPLYLSKLNHLSDPNKIKIGQKLLVPHKNITLKSKQIKSKQKANQIKYKKQNPKFKQITIEQKFLWPVKGNIIARFGRQGQGIYNDGINIATPENTPIKAIDAGIVLYTSQGLRSYGNISIIKHKNEIISSYAHQKKLLVKTGQQVKKGEIIGLVGQTGYVNSPQLYLSIRKNKKPINPELYLVTDIFHSLKAEDSLTLTN